MTGVQVKAKIVVMLVAVIKHWQSTECKLARGCSTLSCLPETYVWTTGRSLMGALDVLPQKRVLMSYKQQSFPQSSAVLVTFNFFR